MQYTDTSLPSAYCVYVPLAVGTLTVIVNGYETDFESQAKLLVDYLSGLSFLHEKVIMHRDISMNNLAVASFSNPRGIILDLDAATFDEFSGDHRKGTVLFLAPEIIELKRNPNAPEYGRSVDCFALGICMFSLSAGQEFRWKFFSTNGQAEFVTLQGHEEFTKRMLQKRNACESAVHAAYYGILRVMTLYEAKDRVASGIAFEQAKSYFVEVRHGSIIPRRSRKRSFLD